GDYAMAFGALMVDITNKIASAQNERIQRQIENLEKEKEISIAFAGDSAAAKGAIEERYARQKAQLQRKQAQNEKSAAIIGAIINTASAVVEALPNIPLSIIVAALGAAEIGIIA